MCKALRKAEQGDIIEIMGTNPASKKKSLWAEALSRRLLLSGLEMK
jgi:TusA-related sulfurtransferase